MDPNHEKKYPYCLIEFVDENRAVDVVPTVWLENGDNNSKLCWWPQDNIKKNVVLKTTPKEDEWQLCRAKVTHYSKSYKRAIMRCNQHVSNLDSTDIEMFSSTEDESSGDEILKPKKSKGKRPLSSYQPKQTQIPHPPTPPPMPQKTPFDAKLDSIEGLVRSLVQTSQKMLVDIASLQLTQSIILKRLEINSEVIPDPDVEIPISSIELLAELDKGLMNEEMFTKLVRYLGRYGGRDASEVTRRILSTLMTNEVARSLNWVGGYGKVSLKALPRIVQLVAASVRQTIHQRNTQQTDVENVIKKWLRTALDRDGGRTKRKKGEDLE